MLGYRSSPLDRALLFTSLLSTDPPHTPPISGYFEGRKVDTLSAILGSFHQASPSGGWQLEGIESLRFTASEKGHSMC